VLGREDRSAAKDRELACRHRSCSVAGDTTRPSLGCAGMRRAEPWVSLSTSLSTSLPRRKRNGVPLAQNPVLVRAHRTRAPVLRLARRGPSSRVPENERARQPGYLSACFFVQSRSSFSWSKRLCCAC